MTGSSDSPFVRERFAGPADVRRFAAVPLDERIAGADLLAMIAARARERPQQAAIRFWPAGEPGPDGIVLTYRELVDRVQRTVAQLRGRGIGAGDVVALVGTNTPEYLIAVLAAMATGVAAPVNNHLPQPTIDALLEAAGAHTVLRDGDPIGDGSDGPASPPRAPREVVALFHTGGTTGQPKFVPLTARNLAATAVFSGFAYGYGPGDRVLCAMPLFHVGGLLACSLVPLACGAEVVIAGPLGYRTPGLIERLWSIVGAERLTVVVGPPTVMTRLAADPPRRDAVSTLRLIVNGAAALPVAVGDALAAALDVPLVEPWGLTEATLAVTSGPREGPRRPGSVGVALPYCEVKAVRIDAEGRELGDCAIDEVGLLAVRGPSVFDGYRGVPADRQPWLRGGWLDTGDLGRIDADGHVWVTGRAKDVIKRGGHGIDPAVIEEALHRHPAVALAAAVGRPDRHAGELPVAFVQLRAGRTATPSELLAHCAAQVAERAAVPKEIVLLPALPVTGIGKIHKPPLRILAAQRVFEQLAGEIAGPSAQVTVRADASRGTVVSVRAPPEHHAALRRSFAGFALPIEVH